MVTPTRTSRLVAAGPLIISPVPFKKPPPPRKNPVEIIPNTSSTETTLAGGWPLPEEEGVALTRPVFGVRAAAATLPRR